MLAPANLAGPRRAFVKSSHRYGAHDLQTVIVWMPKRVSPGPPDSPDPLDPSHPSFAARDRESAVGYWIIFIHGGAWRDPDRTAEDFGPAVDHLIAGTCPDAPDHHPPSPASRIGGLASINYRLSPHPSHPQQQHLNNARHPDHICDVRAALAHLQRSFVFGSRYVLAGHSAGATLAFQVLMDDAAIGAEAAVRVGPVAAPEAPEAVVGVAGIYDLASYSARHGPGSIDLLAGAFGRRDRSGWDQASPARYPGNFANVWPGRRTCVLGWSSEDELVDEIEADGMASRLRRDGVSCRLDKSAAGKHDVAWSEGKTVARLVSIALGILAGE